jgi:transcriptional regulator with XRE-family HTH domain
MLGTWVRAERERRGWSQARLARELDIAQPYLSRLEQGKQENPGGKLLAAIARVFGISLDEVYVVAGLAGAPPADDEFSILLAACRALRMPEQIVQGVERDYRQLNAADQARALDDLRTWIVDMRARQVQEEAQVREGEPRVPPGEPGTNNGADPPYRPDWAAAEAGPAGARIDARAIGVHEGRVRYST